MRDRHHEGGEDRNGQNLVGDGDADDGDERHPNEVQQRDEHADALGAEPRQPAEREFALLLAAEQAAPRQEPAPVLLNDLEAAVDHAIALSLDGMTALEPPHADTAP